MPAPGNKIKFISGKEEGTISEKIWVRLLNQYRIIHAMYPYQQNQYKIIIMKNNLNNALFGILMVVIVVLTSGCLEHRYYRVHHQHSPEYGQRHHRERANVDIDIHN